MPLVQFGGGEHNYFVSFEYYNTGCWLQNHSKLKESSFVNIFHVNIKFGSLSGSKLRMAQ